MANSFGLTFLPYDPRLRAIKGYVQITLFHIIPPYPFQKESCITFFEPESVPLLRLREAFFIAEMEARKNADGQYQRLWPVPRCIIFV